MDMDAHEKHIRALLAFKAWAEPILLALEQDAALATEEEEQPQADPASETAATEEQPAEDAGSAPEQAPVSDESALADAPASESETSIPGQGAFVAEEAQPDTSRPEQTPTV